MKLVPPPNRMPMRSSLIHAFIASMLAGMAGSKKFEYAVADLAGGGWIRMGSGGGGGIVEGWWRCGKLKGVVESCEGVEMVRGS